MKTEDWKNLQEWKIERRSGRCIEIGKKFHYTSRKFLDISLLTKHGKNYFPKIFYIIKKYNPDIFIELGTFQGGLTLAIHEEFPGLEIFSFDKHSHCNIDIWNKVFGKNVNIYLEDLLSNPNEKLLKIINENLNKKIFLYCDNGNKTVEINTYSKYLKIGDVIGCHDWLVEVNPEDVREALESFEMFCPEEWKRSQFLSRFWIKKNDRRFI